LSYICISESEPELLYDWRFTVSQFVLATSPLRLAANNFIFQLNTCSHSPHVISSLTRGWVYRLLMLLDFASAVILRSEPRTLSDSRPPQPGEPGLLIYTPPPRNRVARLYPQALGSLFVVSYAWQAFGGGIRPRLHAG
jgi:hypothetical protein